MNNRIKENDSPPDRLECSERSICIEHAFHLHSLHEVEKSFILVYSNAKRHLQLIYDRQTRKFHFENADSQITFHITLTQLLLCHESLFAFYFHKGSPVRYLSTIIFIKIYSLLRAQI